MSDMDTIQLREYIETVIDLRFEAEHRVAAEQKDALNLLADSIKVHLEHLNGEQARTAKDREQFVLASVYNEMHKALIAKVEKLEQGTNEKFSSLLNDQIVPVKNAQARLAGMGVILIILSGILGSVVTHVFFK